MRLIIPKTLFGNTRLRNLFFLAGPLRGGGDWQNGFMSLLGISLDDPLVAVPYYNLAPEHRAQKWVVEGKQGAFPRQLNWERHYMNIAAKNGCLIFWLPCEVPGVPREPSDGPYAQDTRGELGEIRGRMIHEHDLRVVIGAEEGFHGLSQIQRNFSLALGYDFPIYKTPGETVVAALKKVGV